MEYARLPSAVRGAVLIVAREIVEHSGLSELPGSVVDICRAVEVSRSQAYEMAERIKGALEGVQRHAGRPSRESSPPVAFELLASTRDFLMSHPGCVEVCGERRHYDAGYRDFVLRQMGPEGAGRGLTHEQAAVIFGVPLGTIKDWLVRASPGAMTQEVTQEDSPAGEGEAREAHISGLRPCDPDLALILREYPLWKGSFEGFCRFLQREWRVSFKRTFITSVLEAAGLRKPVRRRQERRPWSEETFRELFPGAQWIGDGKMLFIEWQGEPMIFNLEAIIDVASNAIVGLKITDVEDEAAVLDALAHARATAPSDPLAVTLDRKPSNHTDDVRRAVAPAELIASTKARPTAKAPIEGCFGLFSQSAPPLVVTGDTPREQARSVLELYVLGWCRLRNGRPRRRLGGRTPAQVYLESRPAEQDLAEARAWIAELKRREEKSRETLEAKADPVRRQMLAEALQEFGIVDTDGRLATVLAGSYSHEAILRGLAIFSAKRRMGTLPPGADLGPYLGGIIRNIHNELEDAAYAEALLDLRLRHGELSLRALEQEADRITREHPSDGVQRAWAFLRRALDAQPLVDFRFFAGCLRTGLEELPTWMRRTLYKWMVSEVSHAHKTPRERRRELIAAISSSAAAAAG